MIAKNFLLHTFVALFASVSFANTAIVESDKYRLYSKPHEMKVTITLSDSSEKAIYTVYSTNNDSLAVQIFPERSANRKLLMKEDDLWLYAPGVKKAIRVGLDQRLVGDVANGDILRTRFRQDYTAKEISSEGGQVTFELTRSSKSAAYSKIIYTLEAGTFKPRKAVFLAPSGKELKTAEYVEFKKIGGETLCSKVLITDAQTKRVSTITYSEFKAKKFDANYFNKDAVVDL